MRSFALPVALLLTWPVLPGPAAEKEPTPIQGELLRYLDSLRPELVAVNQDIWNYADIGANYMREHVKQTNRIHYVITRGGGQPNIACATLLVAGPAAPPQRAAQFEGKDTLLRPDGYREWVFVGSSLGLRYDEGKQHPEQLEFKNVYIDPAAYRAYRETGAFPQGTVLVLETAAGEEKKEPGLRGSFQKEFNGLSAAVKDRDRFPDGWAYFSFSDGPGKTKTRAQPAKKAACYDCHLKKGAEDHVFTQFYPVLKAARGGDAIQGTWLPSAAELGGKAFPDEVRKTIKLVVEGDRYTVTVGKEVDRGTVKLNPRASPKELDVIGTEGPNKGKTIPAIYERDGDTLRVCYDLGGKSRPTEFKTREGTQLFLVTYRREKP